MGKNLWQKIIGRLAALREDMATRKYTVSIPPTHTHPENQVRPCWEGLLELKAHYSGEDGMTSDLAQIGELANFYKSLPDETRQRHADEFCSLMRDSVNWKEAFSVFPASDDGWPPEGGFKYEKTRQRINPTWECLLAIKKQYSGPDGLTADPAQIARLVEYYNSLPDDVRTEKEKDFAILMQKCNWEHAFPFFIYVNGTHSPNNALLFKNFLLGSELLSKIDRLKKNLDKESCGEIDNFIARTLQLPEFTIKSPKRVIFGNRADLEDFLATATERQSGIRYRRELPEYRNEYIWQVFDKYFEPGVFTFHHGLRYRGKRILDYIKNRHFIDGGAWLGDSALVFARHYNPAKIHSFEISPKVCHKYRDVMQANNISENLYVINNCGLGEKRGELAFYDNEQEGNTLYAGSFAEGELQANITAADGKCSSICKVVSIDDYVSENDLDVSFIKLDLEGFGLAAIKGARKTIESRLPVLSVGIYHTPEEFFEIKPFIEEITDKYIFYIERHHTDYTCCWDTNLVGVPKFLLSA